MRRKTNIYLAEAIFTAKKNNQNELASLLSASTRKQTRMNLTKINEAKKEAVIIAGKVLSSGEIKNKKTVYAISFSEKALKKLEKAGCECKNIFEELNKNKKLEGEILK